MLDKNTVDDLWRSLFEFKKHHYTDKFQNKLHKVRKESQKDSTETLNAKEVATAREVMSEFIIGMFADLDFVSKKVISLDDVDLFWKHISLSASKAFKEWIEEASYPLSGQKWTGVDELQSNIDDFLMRATKYHSDITKTTS